MRRDRPAVNPDESHHKSPGTTTTSQPPGSEQGVGKQRVPRAPQRWNPLRSSGGLGSYGALLADVTRALTAPTDPSVEPEKGGLPWYVAGTFGRSRRYLAGFFFATGVGHLVLVPESFEAMVPPWVPGSPKVINRTAGLAELVGGALALIPGAERPARRYLTLLLLAVFPANIHMAVRPQDIRGAQRVPRWLLWARLPLQFVAIAWVARAMRTDPADASV
jgi:uncharacterized membrane protein